MIFPNRLPLIKISDPFSSWMPTRYLVQSYVRTCRLSSVCLQEICSLTGVTLKQNSWKRLHRPMVSHDIGHIICLLYNKATCLAPQNNIHLLANSSEGQKSAMVELGSLLRVSQGWSQIVGWTDFYLGWGQSSWRLPVLLTTWPPPCCSSKGMSTPS